MIMSGAERCQSKHESELYECFRDVSGMPADFIAMVAKADRFFQKDTSALAIDRESRT